MYTTATLHLEAVVQVAKRNTETRPKSLSFIKTL